VAIVVLVGILAFSVIPRYQDRGAIDVSAKAEQLANDIRYAQSLAMTSGQRDGINLAAASYQITTSAGTPVVHPATGSSATATPTTSITVVPFNSGTPNLNFTAPGPWREEYQ
jgi:type II secretory pathway pseudopilin PulG